MLRLISGLLFVLGLTQALGAQSGVPLIVLIGPPASGKTTQARILQKERGMTIISVEDVIAQNRQSFEKYARPEIQGVEPRLDPVLNRLVAERLRGIDRSKGVILDGYPASKEQGDHLTSLVVEFGFSAPIVLQLRLDDADVRKRASKSSGEDVEQGLKDYHRELDFAKTYFPRAHIHEIDGAKPEAEVAKEIRRVLASVK
jgi:adenylate kinase family enzyme